MNNIYEKYKVMLVDDEKEILDLISTVLRNEGFNNIYTASSGEEAIEVFLRTKPDIVLLDIMLPDIDGYEIFKKLKSYRNIPILFISAKTDEVDRLLGFALGADDYISKPFSAKEVAFRVKARLKIYNNIVEENKNKIINIGNIEIDEEKASVIKDGEPLELTAKEYKLLVYLANNQNQIISKETICREVWGEDYFGFDNTITVHIRKLRKKIEEDPSYPKYIITVIGLGYKLVNREGNS